MVEEKKVSRIKIKKKRWFPIFAPGYLGQKEVGETYLPEARTALGRVLKINLRDLTGSIRDQNVNLSLRIKDVSGSGLQTEVVGYEFMPSYIRKLVRRDSAKIEDSFILEMKDGKRVQLKPLAATAFDVNNSAKTAIRKIIRETMMEEVSNLTFESLIVDILRNKLQSECRKKLNKISPVREMIMRVVKLDERKRAKVLKRKEGEKKKEEAVAEEELKEEKGDQEAKGQEVESKEE